MYKITVVGTGYVGLANAVLLAQNNQVTALDISAEKIEMLNKRISPIQDAEIQEYLSHKELHFKATLDKQAAYKEADYIIIATPTDYNEEKDWFDCSSIENVIADILPINPNALIVIKSTIPVGLVNRLRAQFHTDNIIFSPEFLREGLALKDSLYPSRIIVGEKSERALIFANLLKQGAIKQDIPLICMNPTEAEAVKLFANSYLAMRVAFFNELDSYCEAHRLNSADVINGISFDPRIGTHYHNPSFGYGGYCLPKDTKQLKSNFKEVKNNLISAIVESNETRKDFIAERIVARNPKTVGVYRLIMKSGSDNFRSAAIFDIIMRLKAKNINIIVYEPTLKTEIEGCQTIADLEQFKRQSDLIIANRIENELSDCLSKVYTRDIFKGDV